MKTFKRNYLPLEIEYNNKTYKPDTGLSTDLLLGVVREYELPTGCIKVEVLNRNLKGKTDFYGKPYQPSIFIFKPIL